MVCLTISEIKKILQDGATPEATPLSTWSIGIKLSLSAQNGPKKVPNGERSHWNKTPTPEPSRWSVVICRLDDQYPICLVGICVPVQIHIQTDELWPHAGSSGDLKVNELVVHVTTGTACNKVNCLDGLAEVFLIEVFEHKTGR
ncbi:hypothetical protein TWF481_009420 [Arthrobotrys musiformis]|uniref:Uncharacterized protein n=1 Tax=Arthrobotrys musiformis TaxID=47236 RepID=A0AAV9W5M7_9PEZI